MAMAKTKKVVKAKKLARGKKLARSKKLEKMVTLTTIGGESTDSGHRDWIS